MNKKYELYKRWCDDCEKLFDTPHKKGKICPECKIINQK